MQFHWETTNKQKSHKSLFESLSWKYMSLHELIKLINMYCQRLTSITMCCHVWPCIVMYCHVIAMYLSNRKRFPCLHSLIQTREGLGEFETVMQLSSVYIRLCKHRGKVFYCFYKITFPRKDAKLFVWHWLFLNSYLSQSLVHDVLHA